MILDYLKRIIRKNVFIAFFIIDFFGFVFLGEQLPWYVFPLSIIVGLLVASYQVYREVKLELDAISGSLPDLEIFFLTEQGPVKKLEITLFSAENRPDFEKIIQLEREKLENKWDNFEPPVISESKNLVIHLSRPSKEAYQSSVDVYLIQFAKYLDTAWHLYLVDSIIRPFQIVLLNKGSVPAKNIVIEINIPSTHLFPTEEEQSWFHYDREEIPDPPVEPDPTKASSLSALADAFSGMSNIAALSPRIFDEIGPQSGPFGPYYDEADQEISYRCDELIHNLCEEEFEPFLLSFSDVTEASDIELLIRIHAANLPEPILTSLKLEIKLSEGPPSEFPAP